MILQGYFDTPIIQQFEVLYTSDFSSRWVEDRAGVYYAADRGPDYDFRVAKITIRDKYDIVEQRQSELKNLAFTDSAVSAIFGPGEEVFGPEIDYSNNIFVGVGSIGEIVLSRTNPGISELTFEITLNGSDHVKTNSPEPGNVRLSWEFNTALNTKSELKSAYAGETNFFRNFRQNSPVRFCEISLNLKTDEAETFVLGVVKKRVQSWTLNAPTDLNLFGEEINGPYTVKTAQVGSLKRQSLNIWNVSFRLVLQ